MLQKIYNKKSNIIALQRNILLLVVCILLLIVLLLSIGLVKKDSKTILVPFNLQDKLSIFRNKIQNDYLVNVSSNVITTILNLTPNNVDYAEKTILNHTNGKSYGILKNQFKIIKDNIVSRKITTAFYPLSIYPNEENLTVQVEGIKQLFRSKGGFVRKEKVLNKV